MKAQDEYKPQGKATLESLGCAVGKGQIQAPNPICSSRVYTHSCITWPASWNNTCIRIIKNASCSICSHLCVSIQRVSNHYRLPRKQVRLAKYVFRETGGIKRSQCYSGPLPVACSSQGVCSGAVGRKCAHSLSVPAFVVLTLIHCILTLIRCTLSWQRTAQLPCPVLSTRYRKLLSSTPAPKSAQIPLDFAARRRSGDWQQ